MGKRWGASAVIAVGLLLTLAATIGPMPLPAGEPGATVAVRLSSAVQTVVLALLGLSVILFVLALRRPRGPVEDGPWPVRAYQPRSVWTALLSVLPFAVLMGAAWSVVWNRWAHEEVHPIERAFTAIAGLLDLLALVRKPPTSVPFFDATIGLLVLLFALALFALLLLITLAERLEKWWAARDAAEAGPRSTRAAAALGDPRAEPDPRRAIIHAWGRFEHALATARAPRAPWQTPAEFVRATLGRLPIPASPARRLTGLFELARFSERPLGAEARVAACECLDQITAALEDDAARAR